MRENMCKYRGLFSALVCLFTMSSCQAACRDTYKGFQADSGLVCYKFWNFTWSYFRAQFKCASDHGTNVFMPKTPELYEILTNYLQSYGQTQKWASRNGAWIGLDTNIWEDGTSYNPQTDWSQWHPSVSSQDRNSRSNYVTYVQKDKGDGRFYWFRGGGNKYRLIVCQYVVIPTTQPAVSSTPSQRDDSIPTTQSAVRSTPSQRDDPISRTEPHGEPAGLTPGSSTTCSPNCAIPGVCDHSHGLICKDGCGAGFSPPLCTDPCKKGWYGVNCSIPCPVVAGAPSSGISDPCDQSGIGVTRSVFKCKLKSKWCVFGCASIFENINCIEQIVILGVLTTVAACVLFFGTIFLYAVYGVGRPTEENIKSQRTFMIDDEANWEEEAEQEVDLDQHLENGTKNDSNDGVEAKNDSNDSVETKNDSNDSVEAKNDSNDGVESTALI